MHSGRKKKLSHDGNPISVPLVVTNAESDCWKWPLKTTEEAADCELLTKKNLTDKKKKPLLVANWLNWWYNM